MTFLEVVSATALGVHQILGGGAAGMENYKQGKLKDALDAQNTNPQHSLVVDRVNINSPLSKDQSFIPLDPEAQSGANTLSMIVESAGTSIPPAVPEFGVTEGVDMIVETPYDLTQRQTSTDQVLMQKVMGVEMLGSGQLVDPSTATLITYAHAMPVVRDRVDGRPGMQKEIGQNSKVLVGSIGQYSYAYFAVTPGGYTTGIVTGDEQLARLRLYEGPATTDGSAPQLGFYTGEDGDQFVPFMSGQKDGELVYWVPQGNGQFKQVAMAGGKSRVDTSHIRQRDEIPTFSPETWAGMDATAKDKIFAGLPDKSPDGYVKSGVSSVKDNLEKYYDAKGQLVQVYDALTGKYETPEEGGVKEFLLNDGTHWEMPYFGGENGQPMTVADVQKAIDYMAKDGAKGTTMQHSSNSEFQLFVDNKVFKTQGLPGKGSKWGGIAVTYKDHPSNVAFGIWVGDIGPNDSFVIYMNHDGAFYSEVVHTSANNFKGMIRAGQVFASIVP